MFIAAVLSSAVIFETGKLHSDDERVGLLSFQHVLEPTGVGLHFQLLEHQEQFLQLVKKEKNANNSNNN